LNFGSHWTQDQMKIRLEARKIIPLVICKFVITIAY
jgi:hypothetical protein